MPRASPSAACSATEGEEPVQQPRDGDSDRKGYESRHQDGKAGALHHHHQQAAVHDEPNGADHEKASELMADRHRHGRQASLPARSHGVARYCKRLISRRARVTELTMMPLARLRKARTMMLADSIAVGNRGTSPV